MDKNAFVRLCKEKYGDEFDYSHLPESIKRVVETIICKKHGKLRLIPRDHLRSKYGCPHCASEKSKVPIKERNEKLIKKAKIKHGGRFDYRLVDLGTESRYKVKIICPTHGIFLSTLKSHLHSDTGCFSCGRDVTSLKSTKYSSLDKVIQALRAVHGNKYKYQRYDSAGRTITYDCPSHGEMTQIMDQHLLGKGCRYCYFDSMRITPEEFLRRIEKVHPEGYFYDVSDLNTVNQTITIKHKCGRVYKGRVSNHLSGQGCMRCRSSFGEDKIQNFLASNQIHFIDQYKINGYRYRYDFCLPELGILIEYDGEQHYRPVEYFGGIEGFKQIKERDREKTLLADLHGFKLIRISYRKFDDLEVHLSRAIDRYFKYRVEGVFYRGIVDLCRALNLPGKTNIREVEHFRTFKALKPA